MTLHNLNLVQRNEINFINQEVTIVENQKDDQTTNLVIFGVIVGFFFGSSSCNC